MDPKIILKILEQSDPKENANCLGILLLLKPVLSNIFETKSYYDHSGLVVELHAKGKTKGHDYILTIRPRGEKK